MLDVRGLQFNSYQDMAINFVPDASLVGLTGDVNDDGMVDIEDVTALIDYLLSNDSALINTANADIDGDGAINITDVTELLNRLLQLQ